MRAATSFFNCGEVRAKELQGHDGPYNVSLVLETCSPRPATFTWLVLEGQNANKTGFAQAQEHSNTKEDTSTY